MSSPHTEAVVDEIYACLVGRTSWESFVGNLAARVPGGKASLFCYNPSKKKGIFNLASPMDEADAVSFRDYYVNVNPLTPPVLERPVDLGTVADALCAREIFVNSEFYNDYLRPQGIESVVGVTAIRDPSCSFFLIGFTGQADGNENEPLARMFGDISPHLRRAFSFYRRSVAREAIGPVGHSILDAISAGALVVNEDRMVTAASPAAREMMMDGTSIRTLGRSLRLKVPGADDALRLMCRRDYVGPKTLTFVSRTERITLVSIEKDPVPAFFEGPSILVLIEPMARKLQATDIEDVGKLFQLSGAEQRVVLGLIEGLSARMIAERHGISVETVRTQIKHIYAKTESNSRVDLIRKLQGLALHGPLG
jgi:DNA-binding CsgD family transcriptional regulator